MRLRLFEYAVLLHPEVDEDGKEKGRTVVVVAPTTDLGQDEKTVAMKAARAIPTEHEEHLDRVEVVVRPF